MQLTVTVRAGKIYMPNYRALNLRNSAQNDYFKVTETANYLCGAVIDSFINKVRGQVLDTHPVIWMFNRDG